jgi:N-acetyl-anhydromuramyl-L-alanine amidase AmpD
MREIKRIVIHCSDSDQSAHDNVETIEQWHKERGFASIGYHFVITKKEIEQGRPIHVQGAHTKGYNDDSIGICVTGRRGFSVKQMDDLAKLVRILKMVYPSIEEVRPHNYYNKEKTCPNFKHELFGDYK